MGPVGVTPLLIAIGSCQQPKENCTIEFTDIIAQTDVNIALSASEIEIKTGGFYEICFRSPVHACALGMGLSRDMVRPVNFGLAYECVDKSSGRIVEMFQGFWTDHGFLNWGFSGMFEAGARLSFRVPRGVGCKYQHIIQAPRVMVCRMGS
jgi:hypothetical protein